MYNSFIVSQLVRLWNFFGLYYEKSFTKKFADGIKNGTKFLFKGSVVKDIFVSDNSFIENTIFYRVYAYIIRLIDKGLKALNLYMKEIGKFSIFYRFVRWGMSSIEKIVYFFKKLAVGSVIFGLIRTLFTIDEAGDQWW